VSDQRHPLDPDVVLPRFLSAEGRLMDIPRKHAKLLVVLDRLAQEFDLGVTYPEREVVARLTRFHDDHAALRRYLVDEGFLTREDGVYWRTGGTVHLDDV
jgi:hypothetical protein